MSTAPKTSHSADEPSVIQTLRVRVVWVGLGLSWILIFLFAGVAFATGKLDELRVTSPLIAMGVGLVGLAMVPWRRVLTRHYGDSLILLWSAAIVAGLIASAGVRSSPPLLAAYAGVVVFAAATLIAPVYLGLVTVLSGAGYLVALVEHTETPGAGEVVARLITVGVVAGLAILLSIALERHLRETEARFGEQKLLEAELHQREQDLAQLYAVSRTMGAGTSIEEVLPALVGRVAQAVKARVGLVLLYSSDDQSLEVISPIWVSGHAVRAEGYRLSITEPGIAQRVFVTSEAALSNNVESDDHDRLLMDLSADRVAAVPLRFEASSIGVLMVTDNEQEKFTRGDLDRLAALAAPAALVLNHVARYQEARETTMKMTELARLKTDFVSVVSHELRTPLTSMIGALATLSRPEFAPTDSNARDLLMSARGQANRLKSLIEDLLVVSRLDNRALPFRPTMIGLDEFLRGLVRGIPGTDRVALDISADLPALEADPDHLSRILTNLIENSMKYAPTGAIEVAARLSGSEIRISVVDHGPGIPYELHDHIFDPFTQVEHHETRAQGGTGLGLSIVRGLTEVMGGRVWYEPTVGGGANFTVAFPASMQAYGIQEQRSSAAREL